MNEGKSHFEYLPTVPATQIEFSAGKRARPCWRCRCHLRFPPRRYGRWRTHWGCGKPVALTHLGDE
jgi:hypothetical protein